MLNKKAFFSLIDSKYGLEPEISRMKVQIVAFGIARDILQGSGKELDIEGSPTIADVKTALLHEYPDFSKLASLRFAVNEEYQSDSYILNPQDEVVIIPPVSGG